MAKLTETFLNYFGRKFTTRFGTKGVSITPGEGAPTDTDEIQKAARKMVQEVFESGGKVGIAPGKGLGFKAEPFSVGRMLSEIFQGIGSNELRNQLVESGNKFIIDLFTNADLGLVVKEEAETQSKLFKQATEIYKSVFGEDLKEGVSGIKQVKKAFKEVFPDRPAVELRPIEARISSRGVAKRGLMPEVMESIVNNLIGSTA
jgi:hypothetical protein